MIAWQLGAFAVLGLALVAGFAWYERTHPSSRVLALVATLAALAALGRVAFAPLPSVKPTLDIILIAGLVLGAAPGFAVGAIGALASNLFFGQGPWTPWQMAIFGGLGLAGAALGALTGRRIGRVSLAIACGAGGYACGTLLDVSTWATFGSGDGGQLGVILARGVPFDIGLAAGNIVFALAFGPALVSALARFRERLDVTWHPAGTTLAVALVAAAFAPAAAHGADPLAKPVAYLRSAQNADGGFGPAKGEASTPLHTAWAAMGLAAAGRAPSAGTVDYVRRSAAKLTDPADLERTILALRAAGAPAGDLVARLERARARDGSFGRQVNVTAFAIFALRAAGRRPGDAVVKGATAWVARQQNRDGGFSFDRRGGPSGIDDTAAALQALVAGGRPRKGAVSRASSYLVARQRPDGGFPLAPGGGSNAQSTAWAIQALVAAGRDPGRVRRRGSRSPIGYLRSLIAPDGSIRYSRTSRQTPVWVTAQALTALALRPFPVPAPRARSARAHRDARPWASTARLGGFACAALLAITRLD
jgi:energy-coupling factor transport system substrate-specific component